MTGRPSDFTEALADRICSELIDGKSLVEVCEAEDMPHRSTVYRWMDSDETFATRCARAREGQADFMDHEILKEAKHATPETASVAKVRISAYQWRAAKLNPKRYGDRVVNEHTGEGGGPIRVQKIERVIVDPNPSDTNR